MKLFYWSAGGLLGLLGLVWVVALIQPRYESHLWWFAVATSESSWMKYCGETQHLLIGEQGYPFIYRGLVVPRAECGKDAIVSQPVELLNEECPLTGHVATNCDSDRILSVMWQPGAEWWEDVDFESRQQIELIVNNPLSALQKTAPSE